MRIRILRLHLKREYWEQVRDGRKTHEFRRVSVWRRKLVNKGFDEVHLLLGYPKSGDTSSILRRKWRGYEERTITHPHFGPRPVRVLAIDVSKAVLQRAIMIFTPVDLLLNLYL